MSVTAVRLTCKLVRAACRMEGDGQMPMDFSTPRITPDMFGQWEGKTVRLCGRVSPQLAGAASASATACARARALCALGEPALRVSVLQVSEMDGGTAVIESTNGGRITVVDSAVDQSVPFVEVRVTPRLSVARAAGSSGFAPQAAPSSCRAPSKARYPHRRLWARCSAQTQCGQLGTTPWETISTSMCMASSAKSRRGPCAICSCGIKSPLGLSGRSGTATIS